MSNPLREKSPLWLEDFSSLFLKSCRSVVNIYIRVYPTHFWERQRSKSTAGIEIHGFRLNRSNLIGFRSFGSIFDHFWSISTYRIEKTILWIVKSNRNIDLMTLLFIIMSYWSKSIINNWLSINDQNDLSFWWHYNLL